MVKLIQEGSDRMMPETNLSFDTFFLKGTLMAEQSKFIVIIQIQIQLSFRFHLEIFL